MENQEINIMEAELMQKRKKIKKEVIRLEKINYSQRIFSETEMVQRIQKIIESEMK